MRAVDGRDRVAGRGAALALALALAAAAILGGSVAARTAGASAPATSAQTGPGLLHFGFNEPVPGTAIGVDDAIRLTRLVGGEMIRATIDWRIMEPRRDRSPPGSWDFHRGVVDRMLAAGIKPLLVLAYAPTWARNRAGKRCGDAPHCLYPPAATKAMNREWREFVTKAAREYPEAAFEIWNEPNWPGFWARPNPKRFAKLQAIAYRAIKRVDRSITVISGGLTGVLVDVDGVRGDIPIGPFLRRAYRGKTSLRRFSDAISLHSYSQGEIGVGKGTETRRRMRTMARLQRRFRDRDPIWITETGISTAGPDAVGLAEQAQGIINRLEFFTRNPRVEVALVSSLVEGGPNPWERGLGVVRAGSLDPKPAYCALVARAGSAHPRC